MPPELPNAISRSKAKQGVLDALGSLHPDDQYLVLLDLLGDLHAIYGAEHAMPESKPSPVAPAVTPEPPAIARTEEAPAPEVTPKSTRKGTARKSSR